MQKKIMVTINAILEEMKNIPHERLSDIYQFVHSLNIDYKNIDLRRKKIMSFAGLLSDMSDEDYADFVDVTKKIRQSEPERNLEFW